MLGAAAACARLLQLDETKTAMALGIAASQPIGLREQFGTMTKPFHPGGAARAGLMSALLASKGFTASPRALEAPRGFAQVVSTKHDWNEITHELGSRFEISFNTYKPFACGIVIHPSIDAATQLRARGVKPDDVERIELRVHPLVLELTGKKEPADGLQAKFSVYHGVAAGLVFGRAGEDEFSDDVVRREDLVALRRKVIATVDRSIDEASADVVAVLTDGRREHVFVEHAIGSLQRPMSDADLDAKFESLVAPVLGKPRSKDARACGLDGRRCARCSRAARAGKTVVFGTSRRRNGSRPRTCWRAVVTTGRIRNEDENRCSACCRAARVFRSDGVAVAQQPARPPVQTTKVEGTDNVYVFRNGGAQSMFIVTPDGVIATDPIGYGRPTAGQVYLAEIRKVTDRPIRYVIYSHHHFDHSAGGKALKDAGATFIAHRRAKERLEVLKDPNTVVPDEAVGDNGRTITLGGTTLELTYHGINHSDSNLVMRLPKERIIFLVDAIPVGHDARARA